MAEENTDMQKRRAAYTEATTALRETYRDAFNKLYEAALEARGMNFKRRHSKEEVAEQTIEDLFAEYPHLREKYQQSPQDRKPGFLN